MYDSVTVFHYEGVEIIRAESTRAKECFAILMHFKDGKKFHDLLRYMIV
ncbi:hypothetical protein APHCRT_0399 [Anaplasma phagocytophilum str. CRT53-1]|uniref:Uncharacterized protein n=5 Tax=Anaplasma phagocytophilum TaxID=948 RepID=A0A0F3NJT5_ANAPH|nr:hypothetical protein APHWEB_0146 [Anaplasma phagocytophilum str. Webster]KJV65056.1 hypothetical protein APHMUC_1644 [Anaplasma phagocytophilum str. ApMUC09]KJV67157.1 hypothetical protein APHNP_1502 [Anaplasma phagocytophilum str. ApNP]KJV68041.1 hypothetical protein EPHNCH_0590 [Anaplasma phagocytophilum str. NCH-1]KJV82296.1 hypothetical protein APHHGE2_0595 [Anaplasma phagocytophilum str. HGE2]KJV84617.1 hypothetical protein APHWI1_1375 [Anaplasma phagocytophilum str. ApWI1]KJV87528.1 